GRVDGPIGREREDAGHVLINVPRQLHAIDVEANLEAMRGRLMREVVHCFDTVFGKRLRQVGQLSCVRRWSTNREPAWPSTGCQWRSTRCRGLREAGAVQTNVELRAGHTRRFA